MIDEEDPIIYGERQMPVFQGYLITTENGEIETIYPTRAKIREIYKKMNELSIKRYGYKMFDLKEN